MTRTWTGSWVGSGDDGPAAPLLRGEIEVPDGVVRAVVHTAGLGLHRTTLDGVPVTDARLESGTSAFDRRIAYSSDPVTLAPGRAVVGVELGRGFYAMTTPSVWLWEEAPWRGLRAARVDVEMLDADGAVVTTVGSDLTWRWSTGGTRSDSFYEGETFDAREEQHGWDHPGFDASGWSPVVAAEPPGGLLEPRRQPPIRVVDSLSPVGWSGGDGAPLVADFGTQLAGWVRVEVPRAPAGTRVRLHYAEDADATGARARNPHVLTERFAVDELVVDDRTRIWEPRFTYQGFRYVEVEGVDHPDDVVLTAQHAHADVAQISTFACSDEVLTWIDTAMRLTVRNNLHHVPSDTPLYEKNGWLGDVHVALGAMLHQADVRTLLTGWTQAVADTQRESGQLAVIAPTAGWGYIEAPEWTTVYPTLLWTLDAWFGADTLPPGWRDTLVRYLERELARVDEQGLVEGVLGDYLTPGSTGTPPDDDLRVVSSCYLVRALRLSAELLDRDPDEAAVVQRLRDAAHAMADAVNDTFLDRERGCYRSDREPEDRDTSSILPLAFGITPAEHVPAVVAHLARRIRERGDRHDSGCLGLSELFEVLSAHGEADLALAVATGTRAPSWGAWHAAGETTMLEMWGPEQRSRNHFFMGSMARWLYERVAGVRRTGPGWRTFAVDPVARGDLAHASFFLRSPLGELGASWSQDAGTFRLRVVVPPGAVARVHLPGDDPVDAGPGEWEWVREVAGAAAS